MGGTVLSRRRGATNPEARQRETIHSSGKTVFTQNCATCHTLADAKASGDVGPNLDQVKPSKAKVQSQVENGGGGTPAVAGRPSPQQIQAAAADLTSSAGQGGSFADGRPGT